MRVGAAISLRLPKELPALSPGFYTAVCETGASPAAAGSMVRVYWNISRSGVPVLVRELTSRLNAEQVPFRLKVADHALRFDRCDAAVLYLQADTFDVLRDPLHQIAIGIHDVSGTAAYQPSRSSSCRAWGWQRTTPRTGASASGGARCSPTAIVRAHEQGAERIAARLDAVADRFAADGVSIDAPYRAPTLVGRHVL